LTTTTQTTIYLTIKNHNVLGQDILNAYLLFDCLVT